MCKIELNKTFQFEITKFEFGDLSRDELIRKYRDGRSASPFLETQITKWFPDLVRKEVKVNRAVTDHVDRNGNLYEMRCFTKSGCKLVPSNQQGSSRKIDTDIWNVHANEIRYIICDIRTFPEVRVVFKKGSDLVSMFPNGAIPEKKSLFIMG